MVVADLATVRFRIYDDPSCTTMSFNTTYCVLLNSCQPIYLSQSDRVSGVKSGIYGVYNYEHYSNVHDDNTYGADDNLDAYVFLLDTYSDPKCTYTIQGSQQISELSLNCYQDSCCPFQVIYGINGMKMKYAKLYMDDHLSSKGSCPPNSTAYIDRIANTKVGAFEDNADMSIIAIGVLIGCMLTIAIQTWCKRAVKLPDNCENLCSENGVSLIECLDTSGQGNVDESTILTSGSGDSTGYMDYLSSFVLPSRDNSADGKHAETIAQGRRRTASYG